MPAQSPSAKLRFSDDPMFKRVMEREDICKGVLERIIGRPVEDVAYHNTEQERRLGPSGKTIRMDSYLVESEGDVFDVEMQMSYNPLLPRRFRAYQSILDGSFLKRGEDYSELRGSYVIFICFDDPFGSELPVYTFERSCAEEPPVDFDCGSHWIALNASAYSRLGQNSPLGALLQYIYTDRAAEDDGLLQSIETEVARNNDDKEWLMTMIDSITIAEQEARIRGRMQGREEGRREGHEEGRAQGLAEGRAEGKAEGRAQGRTEGKAEGRAEGRVEGIAAGESRYAALVARLLEEGRTEDLKRANSDPGLRKQLYEEYGI